jgi:hypothetical protein
LVSKKLLNFKNKDPVLNEAGISNFISGNQDINPGITLGDSQLAFD